MKKRFDSTAFLFLSLVLFIALCIAFLVPVTPQDYWWYLRVGRDTLATGAVPRLDTFTFTRAGTAVQYQSWGAAILFYLLYRAGGLGLSVFVRGLLLGLTYGLVWQTARRAGTALLSGVAVLLAAVLTSSNNWSMRPQLFAYPLFALALYLLYRWQEGDRKAAWALPLLSLLWVNLHGSFVMLILLTGAALVFGKGDRKTLALAFGGVLLATLLNPRGVGTWTYVVNSLQNPSNQLFSREWGPPLNKGWQLNLFFLWLLGFPLLLAISKDRLSHLEWTWFLGFGFLALWGVRYVIWFVFILVVLTGKLLAGWEKQRMGEVHLPIPAFNLALAAVLLLLPLGLLPGLRETWWKQSPPVTENTPIAATEWLAAHPNLNGPLWSEIGFSSYLEYQLPQRPTWIDTRFEVFPVDQWQAYKDITTARYDWNDLLGQAGVNLLMVSTQNQGDLDEALQDAPGWCQVYRDPLAAIYARGGCQEVK